MAERPQVPSWALRGKEGVGHPRPRGAIRHGSFHTSQGPQEKKKKKLWEEGHFLPGVFLFSLPNRKLAPEEAELLPFDPPRSQALTDNSPEGRLPRPQADLPFPDTEQIRGAAGSPRLPGTSGQSAEQGPHSRPCVRAGPLQRMSARRGSGLPPHCPEENQSREGRHSHGPQGWKILQAWNALPLLHPFVHGGSLCQQKRQLWLPTCFKNAIICMLV